MLYKVVFYLLIASNCQAVNFKPNETEENMIILRCNVIYFFQKKAKLVESLLGANEMNNKIALTCIAALVWFLFTMGAVVSASESINNYKPQNGYVPDAETAIKIAVAVWTPIYGKGSIERQKPYQATLRNGIWYVTGSLPKNTLGGVAEAEISRDDGRIIRIIHGQ